MPGSGDYGMGHATIGHERSPRRQRAEGCPFLSSVTGDRASACPGGVSCDVPSRLGRVPSRDEMAWFCTNGRHFWCPIYRQWLGRAGEERALGG